MLGVGGHIDECAAGLTPQFSVFPFCGVLAPFGGVGGNRERLFVLKCRPVLGDLRLG